jgi:hypothetical protein
MRRIPDWRIVFVLGLAVMNAAKTEIRERQ